jgi:diaminohydroxyphosphoribosylaminopyrimidine deaminase/5-amino-6-(5-phosphoribosylamino)uracil reductase
MMRHALKAAAPYLGAASPNPSVGAAAFDADGSLLAAAAHLARGEAHAEQRVFDLCRAEGTYGRLHTLAVTLEPCNHHGLTPPCADAILSSPVRRVVVGLRDPNSRARGGLVRLAAAGIETSDGILAASCWNQMAGFVMRHAAGRPFTVM